MPTRKQRRRRAKLTRHDYTYVTYDDEGNEIEVDPAELRKKKDAEKPAKPKPQQAKGKGGRRPAREPQPPSWRRSLRRGGLWGGIMFIVVVFLFQDAPIASRIAWGVLYAIAFVPLTYWIDRIAYRSYLKRSGRGG